MNLIKTKKHSNFSCLYIFYVKKTHYINIVCQFLILNLYCFEICNTSIVNQFDLLLKLVLCSILTYLSFVQVVFVVFYIIHLFFLFFSIIIKLLIGFNLRIVSMFVYDLNLLINNT